MAQRAAALLAVALVLTGPASAQEAPERTQEARCPGFAPYTASLPHAVARMHDGVRISVDPRVELMAVIQELSGYRDAWPMPLLNPAEFGYRSEVHARFGHLRTHAAVELFDRLSRPRFDEQGQPSAAFAFGGPPESVLYLRADLTVDPDLVVDSLLAARLQLAPGEDATPDAVLRVLACQLADFARVSGFADHYDAHRDFYRALVDGVVPAMAARNQVAVLEEFYGTRQAGYHIILAPLYGPVGYGPRTRRLSGDQHVYAVLGPLAMSGEGGADYGTAERFGWFLSHEFSHSFINPLTAAHRERILPHTAHFADLPAIGREQVCGDWEDCINEHVIRAVTTWLAYEEGDEAGERARESELRRGMVYLPALLERLAEYASQRDRYPTLASYYERLLEVFSEPVP